MIVEVADFQIDPAQHEAFKTAIAHGLDSVLSGSPGYMGHQVLAGIENPGRFVLLVRWKTLEDHTVGFRESPLFPNWRAIVGPFFASPPKVEHFVVSDQV